MTFKRAAPALVALLTWSGCGDGGGPARPPIPDRDWQCTASATATQTDALAEIGCRADFDLLGSAPLDASVPGARSVKVIMDRANGNTLTFQDSNRFATHYEYASQFLSGGDLPIVPLLADFNSTEYSSPTRRFMLGSVSYYEGPDLFVYEIAPYDGASAEMIVEAFAAIELATYFGAEMRFYANSATVEETVAPVRNRLEVITTEELFAGIDYQPLNVAESFGRLTFIKSEDLDNAYVGFRDIAVLDRVPNDISVVAGIVTEEFQTNLSHINVLSRNRGTPNMGLRGAFDNADLRALEGQWVRLNVTPTEYTIEAATQAEADAWWEANRPDTIQIPGIDTSVTGLTDIQDVVDRSTGTLKEALGAATRAYGGKAAHYSVLAQTSSLPVVPGFAIPVFYYQQFMQENGFDSQVDALLANSTFINDPAMRDMMLDDLRDEMRMAPINQELIQLVYAKLAADFPDTRMRFRSSTNAEDLDGFTGAGLYNSKSGQPGDAEDPIEDAMRSVWSSVWRFRAFEERSYRGIDHKAVAMAMLVHRSFPDEEANGVALTNNPFDPSGLEPAFFINVQKGEVSVVLPPEGVTTESILYYFDRANQPASYLSKSSLVGNDETVLSNAQLFELGTALKTINETFASAYGGTEWWAMDVEFKFDGEEGETPALIIKQARPFQ